MITPFGTLPSLWASIIDLVIAALIVWPARLFTFRSFMRHAPNPTAYDQRLLATKVAARSLVIGIFTIVELVKGTFGYWIFWIGLGSLALALGRYLIGALRLKAAASKFVTRTTRLGMLAVLAPDILAIVWSSWQLFLANRWATGIPFFVVFTALAIWDFVLVKKRKPKGKRRFRPAIPAVGALVCVLIVTLLQAAPTVRRAAQINAHVDTPGQASGCVDFTQASVTPLDGETEKKVSFKCGKGDVDIPQVTQQFPSSDVVSAYQALTDPYRQPILGTPPQLYTTYGDLDQFYGSPTSNINREYGACIAQFGMQFHSSDRATQGIDQMGTGTLVILVVNADRRTKNSDGSLLTEDKIRQLATSDGGLTLPDLPIYRVDTMVTARNGISQPNSCSPVLDNEPQVLLVLTHGTADDPKLYEGAIAAVGAAPLIVPTAINGHPVSPPVLFSQS